MNKTNIKHKQTQQTSNINTNININKHKQYIAQSFQNGFSAMDALRVGFVEADQNLCQFYKNSKQKTAAGSTAGKNKENKHE